jgi:cytoskeletal protein RodZ
MDKKLLIDEYLQGKHPIEGKKWELPTESELDRDEALFDALLEERKTPKRHILPIALRWVSVAAVLLAVLALFTWKSLKPQDQPQLAEKTEELVPQEDTPSDTSKLGTPNSPTRHVKLANITRYDDQHNVPRLKSSQPKIADEPQTSTETPVLANAADSLYYYLTQLENQMGDCRDSTCLAELGNLMQADERIKDLVNKIIHKQVETAYQEEYLVDTTTRYIPL